MLFERARMRLCPVRALLAITGASAALGGGGCSSTQASAADAGVAPTVCPDTPEATIGAACSQEGLVCGPGYACAGTTVSLYCACTSGVFVCRDGTGQTLQAGGTPACPSSPPPANACPATTSAANLTSCATTGQMCTYLSACPGALDVCTCFPGATADGGFGKVYGCQAATCAADAAPPPPGGDAGVDAAPPEASAPGDARSDATSDASDEGQDTSG